MIESMLSGLIVGSGYAIIGLGVVLLYRFTGTLNFAHAAIGAFGAFVVFIVIDKGAPFAGATIIGILISATIAGLVGLVMIRWFADSGQITQAVMSVVVFTLVLAAGFRLFGDSPRYMPQFWDGKTVSLAGINISLDTVVATICTLILALASGLFLRYTKTGVKYLAMSENASLAKQLGVPTTLLTLSAWITLGGLSTLGALFVAPTYNPTFLSLSMLIVPALAAALLGGFKSLMLTTLGGLLLGAVEGLAAAIPKISSYRGAIAFLIIIVALLWMRRKNVWGDER